MHLKIRHRTEYRYETPVRYSIQELRLTPPTTAGQQIDKWKISTPIKASSSIDTFGNFYSVFLQESPYTVDEVLKLATAVQQAIGYVPGQTTFATTAAQSFALKSGVCQDHAHVMLSLCRAAQIPARYVSGYFFAEESPNLASHAWIDFCSDIEKGIWISVDITHACLIDARHIRLAIGRDYYSAAPVKGVRTGGGGEELSANISIQQLP